MSDDGQRTPDPVRRDALERVSDGIIALDTGYHYTYVNQRAEQVLDTAKEDLLGEYVWDVFPDAADTTAETQMREAMTTTEQRSFERYNADLDKWFSVRVYPDDTGLTIHFTDITDRKQNQTALREANRRLTALVENTSEAIYIKDRAGTYQFMNEAAAGLFDRTPGEVVGKDDEALFDADSAAAIRAVDRDILDTGRPHTSEAVRWIDGERHVFLDNKYPYRDDDGDIIGIMGISREITDRKRREEALTTLHEATPAFLAATDRHAVAEQAVDAARTVLDQPLSTVWLYGAADDALEPAASTDRARELFEEIPTYNGGDSLTWQVFESGEARVYDEVHDQPGRYNESTPVESEIVLPLGDHGVMNVGATDPQAFDDIDVSLARLLGDLVQAALARADREQELRARQEALERQNDRLEGFASIVSHDLRNPLNVADGYLEMAQADYDGTELDEVAQSLDRMNALIDDILTLAREGNRVNDLEMVELTELVETSWRTVETADGTLDVASTVTVRADRSRMQQLLENVFRNAVEHGGAAVTVTVGSLAEGFYVADDGPGVPPDKRERVFEQGYSAAGDGTGFGLAIVAEIADGHGWTVEVTDSESGGARFEFTGVDIVA